MRGASFPYRWNDNYEARIGLLPLEGNADDIVWCACDPCYIFHVVNAYDDESGNVIMDAPAYPSIMRSGMGPLDGLAKMERFTINPQTKSVSRELIDESNQEFARIDERLTGRRHRFAYTLAINETGPNAVLNAGQLYRHDLKTGQRQTHDFGPGRLPGEFVFVPRGENAAEEDGWMVGYVINVADKSTDFVIINADDFEAKPQARVTIPRHIPPGFHGNWLADD